MKHIFAILAVATLAGCASNPTTEPIWVTLAKERQERAAILGRDSIPAASIRTSGIAPTERNRPF